MIHRKYTNGLSLLKRRTWYADADADDSADDDAPEPTPKTGDSEKTFPESVVSDLRKENAKWRKQLRDLEAWKADQEASAKKASDAKLAEEGKYKDMVDARDKELADLKAQLAREAANNLRMKIGVELKVPAPLISRLQGDTEDALREDAQALIESLGLNQQPQTDEKPQQTPARRQQTTTTVPDGQPPQDSPEARRKARQERTPSIFEASPVRFVNKSQE